METLDFRPLFMRRLTAWWEREDADAGGAGRVWSRAVQVWVDRRVRRRPLPAARPYVVSIGTLAVGGTGKTPVTAALARDLALAGLKVAVVTRGYRSARSGPLVVDPQDPGAGDEARWLAGRLQELGCAVIQAHNRAAGLAAAQGSTPTSVPVPTPTPAPTPDVVILEDGHQSAGVGRHLDILILDRWTTIRASGQDRIAPGTGPVIPWGPWREGPDGARRAAFWLLETAAPVPDLGCWGNQVATFVRARALGGTGSTDPAALRGLPWAALSGIARPAPFEAGAADLMGRPADLVIRAADHQAYDAELIGRILAAVRRCGACCLVTTDKDWVKLERLWPAAVPVLRVVQDLTWGQAKALPVLVRERWQEHCAGGG